MIKALPTPSKDERMLIVRDSRVEGLGVRVLPTGTRAFVLDYTAAGRRRLYTIGKFPEWKIVRARAKATELKDGIEHHQKDPAEQKREARVAPTVADLCEQFQKEHMPKLRPSTRSDYGRMIENDIKPELENRKVRKIEYADLAKLHRRITDRGSPAAANFCLRLCSKLFAFAIRHRMIETNPAKGIEYNRSQPRNRYLSSDEIKELTKALNKYADQDVADIFRLLMLTGARRGETRSAKWEQFDLTEGTWTKPSSATKQAREHRVPLAAPARQLLAKRRAQADSELRSLKRQIAAASGHKRSELVEWRRRVEAFVFPSRKGALGHIENLKKPWGQLCKAAKITGARTHDLRHTAASVLASSGASLPLIGQLLGHTTVATTARYSHLFDDAQRAAVERLGAVVTGGPSAEVIELKGRRREKR